MLASRRTGWNCDDDDDDDHDEEDDDDEGDKDDDDDDQWVEFGLTCQGLFMLMAMTWKR